MNVNKLIADIRNFDRNNCNEKLVLESNYFSVYSGKLVIRTKLRRSGSLGVLFISKCANQKPCPEDEIRHEYGHTKQFKYLGIIKYILCIGLPSFGEWGSDREYYRRPWEITADMYGAVSSRAYSDKYKERGMRYLESSKLKGTRVWRQIV